MNKKFTFMFLFMASLIFGAALADDAAGQTGDTCVSKPKFTAENTIAVVSAGVVISEAYGGSELGGGYNADFIELYNQSSVSIDISDYSVQYYTSGQINGGAPTSTAHIPAATILGPFGYYVIRVSPDNRAGSPIPCAALNASASFAETGIEAGGGKLVLTSTGADLPDCTSSLNVVDRLGYGVTPVVCNETANAIGHSGATTTQRYEVSSDTDDNSADFYAGSGPTPCSGLLNPLAAQVNVGGRVTDAAGRGLSKVLVQMQDGEGTIRATYTSPFGFYNFLDVEVGNTLVLSVSHKRYSFAQPTRVLSLDDEATNADFVGQIR